MPETTPQDDLLIAIALARLHHDFESAEPTLADRAAELAQRVADDHGLALEEVPKQLDIG